ncbi:hypothetical protein [Schumannella sp. 10F1B-5-1]|uniref:hypothetical protein n=1 Tax=Schumannella sp. 10F1B-5-1 TaxID=2590780 RepID=UPI0011302A09|nr:hypothetical protein [Schumannella sp. 10F1B-5-1]TPW78322.1 hypothetical protein FJ658_00495 [Schumannella sp. 10F1B-5-1]
MTDPQSTDPGIDPESEGPAEELEDSEVVPHGTPSSVPNDDGDHTSGTDPDILPDGSAPDTEGDDDPTSGGAPQP